MFVQDKPDEYLHEARVLLYKVLQNMAHGTRLVQDKKNRRKGRKKEKKTEQTKGGKNECK
jgi:hypothetical protein